jgi:prepilin-type N-terminal cleavage/methylation domain-containing protein
MKHHAFTLVELMVVISLIGILSSLAVVSTTTVRSRGRDAQRKSDLDQLRVALLSHYNTQSPSGFFPCFDRTAWNPTTQLTTSGTSFSACGSPSADYIAANSPVTADTTDYESREQQVRDATTGSITWSSTFTSGTYGTGILMSRLIPNYLKELPNDPNPQKIIAAPLPVFGAVALRYHQYAYCSYHNSITGASYAVLAANSMENTQDSTSWKTGLLCANPIATSTSVQANNWRYRILIQP